MSALPNTNPSLAPTPPAPTPTPAAPAPPPTPPAPAPTPAPAPPTPSPTPAAPAPSATPTPPAPTPDPSIPSLAPASPQGFNPDGFDLNSAMQSVGLDPRSIAEEFTKSGRVGDETISALRQIEVPDENGKKTTPYKYLPKSMIQDHVRGQAAIYELKVQSVKAATKLAEEAVGGSTQLENIKAWASNPANFDASRLAALQQMVAKNPSFYPDAVRIIAAEHASKVGANGSKPIIQGGTPGGSSPKPTTLGELAALNAKALAGDADAMRTLMAFTDEERSKLR